MFSMGLNSKVLRFRIRKQMKESNITTFSVGLNSKVLGTAYVCTYFGAKKASDLKKKICGQEYFLRLHYDNMYSTLNKCIFHVNGLTNYEV